MVALWRDCLEVQSWATDAFQRGDGDLCSIAKVIQLLPVRFKLLLNPRLMANLKIRSHVVDYCRAHVEQLVGFDKKYFYQVMSKDGDRVLEYVPLNDFEEVEERMKVSKSDLVEVYRSS